MRQRILACALTLLASAAQADEVLLKGGGKLSGRILSRTDAAVTVDVGPGTITVPMRSVASIEERHSVLDEYHERAAHLREDDVPGWLRLGRWATSQGLGTQARQAYDAVLAIDPANHDANIALGRVLLEGHWVPEAESYRARGYVWFEGEWMPMAERNAALAQRDQAHRAEWSRLEAERRIRDAEARAADAEAAARQAQMTAYAVGAPLWYGGVGYGFVPSYGYGHRSPGRPGRKGPGAGETWPPDINRTWPTGPLGFPSQNMGVYPSQPLGVWHQPSAPPGGGAGHKGGPRERPGPNGPPPGASGPTSPPAPPSRPSAKPVRPR